MSSFILNVVNILAAYGVIELFYHQYKRIMKPTSINEVLFSNNSATCHISYKKSDLEFNCSNRYCLKKNLSRIIELIESTEHYICLAMYHFYFRELQQALTNAHRRGVKIQIVTTAKSMTELPIDLHKLLKEGILAVTN